MEPSCKYCGHYERDHAKADNAYCPKGRCPGKQWPRGLHGGKDNAWPPWPLAKQQMWNFWNERQTSFEVQEDPPCDGGCSGPSDCPHLPEEGDDIAWGEDEA